MEEEEPDEEGIWKTLESCALGGRGLCHCESARGGGVKDRSVRKARRDERLCGFYRRAFSADCSEYRQKLTQRVQEPLGDVKADESRLLTEVTVYADKICGRDCAPAESYFCNEKISDRWWKHRQKKLDFLARKRRSKQDPVQNDRSGAVQLRESELKTLIEERYMSRFRISIKAEQD